MNNRFFQKTSALLANFSLFLHIFLPALTAIPAFAEEPIPTPTPTSIVESTPAPTAEPTIAVTPTAEPTAIPTPEPTATPTAEPTVEPTAEPTAIPTEEPTITPTPVNSEIGSLNPATEIVQALELTLPQVDPTEEENNFLSPWTFEKVELNKEYVAPQNSGVKLTFTKLPANAGNIKIEEITLTKEQIEQTGSLSDKAYDITSDMADGSFAYNLSLPIPESSKGKSVEVKFAEEISNIGSAVKVDSTLTKTDTSVSVTSLDHFTIFFVTDQTPTAPLSSPSSSAQPRYISGFGLDNNYTIFYEDRNVPCGGAYRIYFNQTTSGPSGLSATGTATNICDTHFTVKNWPITISGVTYAYRAWGSGSSGTHNFYVSNDLVNWTLDTTFTFNHPSDGILYGFHDIVQLNGHYIGWVESAGGNTYIASSINGDGGTWTIGAQVGGATAGAAPLSLYFFPSIEGPKPSGNFVKIELDGQLTYAKIYLAGDYSGAYLAINRAAAQATDPALAEAAFMNPANWTWRDGTTGLPKAADTVISNTTSSGGHDIREGWTVPMSGYQSDYVFLYSAGYSTGAKGLGYLVAATDEYTQADFTVFDGVNSTLHANGYTVSSGIGVTYTGSNTIKLTGYAPIVTPWFGLSWTTYNYVTIGIKLPAGFTGTTVYQTGVMRYDDLTNYPNGYYKMGTIGDGSTPLATTGAAAGYLDFSFAANSPNTKKDGLVKLEVIWNASSTPEYFTIDISDLSLIDTTAPTVPVLTSPINGVVTNNNALLMQWDNSTDTGGSGIAGYEYQVYYNCSDPSNIPGSCSGPYKPSLLVNSEYQAGVTTDGTYYWQVRAKDNTGNFSNWSGFEKVIIDIAAPTNPTPLSTSHTVSTWDNDRTVAVSWSGASDATSGVDGFYTEWNTSATTMAGPVGKEHEETVTSEISPTLATGQNHYFHIATVDNAGNWTSTAHLGPFWIDASTPAASWTTPVNGAILHGNVPLEINATDPDSGMQDVRFQYRIVGSTAAFTLISTDTSNPFQGTWNTGSADGNYTLRALARNTAGGTRTINITVTVDNTDPTITVNTFITNDTTPKLTGTVNDNSAAISVSINGNTFTATNKGDGTWELTDGTIAPSLSDGTYNVTASATDTAGNIGTDSTDDELTIDTVAPTATHKYYRNGTEVSGLVYVKNVNELTFDSDVTDSDPSSGLRYETFSIFDANSNGSFGWNRAYCGFRQSANTYLLTGTHDISLTGKRLTDCITTLSEGNYYVMYGEYDNAARGTDTAVTQYRDVLGLHFIVDKTAPTITLGTYSTAPTNQDITVTVSTNEGNLNVGSTTFTANGSFDFIATDDAGNVTTKTVTITNIDKTDPASVITTFNLTNGGSVTTPTWNGRVEGTASDDRSGVNLVKLEIARTLFGTSLTEYWNGSSWQNSTTTVNATDSTSWNYQLPTPAEGTYKVTSHAVDNAGNVENTYSITIIYDKTINEVALSIDPAVGDASNGWYKTQPTITLNQTDVNFDRIEYQWDSQTGTWTVYSTPFKPTTEGAHVLYYRAVDKANNNSGIGIKNIAWDQTDLEYGPQNISANPNPTSGSTSKIKWDFAKDNTGIDKYEVQWSLSGLNYSKTVGAGTSEVEIDQLTEGSWTVKVVAFDRSGHTKDGSINLNVDRSGPVAPVLTLAGTSAGTATLSWNAIADATDYIVWYGNAPGSRLYGARVGNMTSYTVRSLGAGNYYFIVKAVDAAQNQGAESNEVSTGTIAGAANVEPGTPAEGFTEEVLGTTTTTEATTPTPTLNPTLSDVLGISANNINYLWWLLLILPFSLVLWLIFKKKRNK